MDAVCRLGEAAETRDLLGRQLIQMETLQVKIPKIQYAMSQDLFGIASDPVQRVYKLKSTKHYKLGRCNVPKCGLGTGTTDIKLCYSPIITDEFSFFFTSRNNLPNFAY